MYIHIYIYIHIFLVWRSILKAFNFFIMWHWGGSRCGPNTPTVSGPTFLRIILAIKHVRSGMRWYASLKLFIFSYA